MCDHPDVALYDLDHGTAVLESGEIVPITNYFDRYGDEIELDELDEVEADDIKVLVAGPTRDGKWLVWSTSSFTRMPTC